MQIRTNGNQQCSYKWASWNWKKLVEVKNFRANNVADLFSIKFSIPSKNSRSNQMMLMHSQIIMEKLGFWLVGSNFSLVTGGKSLTEMWMASVIFWNLSTCAQNYGGHWALGIWMSSLRMPLLTNAWGACCVASWQLLPYFHNNIHNLYNSTFCDQFDHVTCGHGQRAGIFTNTFNIWTPPYGIGIWFLLSWSLKTMSQKWLGSSSLWADEHDHLCPWWPTVWLARDWML